MELRTGKIVDGAVVLDDTSELEEGARVSVWVGEPDQPIRVGEEELKLIREGQRAASRGQQIEARAFLAELRAER